MCVLRYESSQKGTVGAVFHETMSGKFRDKCEREVVDNLGCNERYSLDSRRPLWVLMASKGANRLVRAVRCRWRRG